MPSPPTGSYPDAPSCWLCRRAKLIIGRGLSTVGSSDSESIELLDTLLICPYCDMVQPDRTAA